MKKYRIIISYCGAIPLEIEANNEEEAIEKSENIVSNMNCEEFIEKIDLQIENTEITKVI